MADEFQADDAPPAIDVPEIDGALIVDLDGYEGPLDVLLTLARHQKVDLRKISILALAEQYLAFVAAARRINLELAADYLVMAAWLAYLKSRLMIPDPEPEEGELSAEQMAARLAFRLRRLEAMRNASQLLLGRPRAGINFFARGMPEGIRVIRTSVYECTMYELLKAYGDFKSSKGATEALPMRVMRTRVISMEEALARLKLLIGDMPDWTVLQSFLPEGLLDDFSRRSAMASTFTASLEMARQGRLDIRQMQPFGPLFLKRADRTEETT